MTMDSNERVAATIRGLTEEARSSLDQAIFELEANPDVQAARARTLMRMADGLLRDAITELGNA